MMNNFAANRWKAALVGLCFFTAARPASSQTATYSYDGTGNTTSAMPPANGAPIITAPPQSGLIESNSFATFSVGAAGSGLSYQWLSNGIVITGANGDSLVLGNLPLVGTNLGTFSVIISNAYGMVTSTPVALWPDANGNGIPDWWEMKYFGNLSQPALGDYDGDGVNNLNEYLEGTNPTNRLSFNPRLSLQVAHGSGAVSASPNQPYYTLGQLVTLSAIPDGSQGFAGWSGAVNGNKSPILLIMNTNESVTANFGFPLGVALGNTNLVWTTSGDQLWFGQAEVSQDGFAAAQSGPIVSYFNGSTFVGDQTSLQTSFYLSQPEQLGFWWDVSSQPPDGVTFAINTNVVAMLAGQAVPWQHFQTNLSAGLYTVTWTYAKGPVNIPNGISYVDSAWLGDVTLTSTAPTAVRLGIQLAGASALLSWPTNGTGSLTLQSSTNLDGGGGWQNLTTTPPTVGTNYQVPVSVTGQAQFFRLH